MIPSIKLKKKKTNKDKFLLINTIRNVNTLLLVFNRLYYIITEKPVFIRY